MRDMFFDFLPQHSFAKQILWSGHVPLWDSHSGSGKPFLADPQTATLYPVHAVFYIFPVAVALRIYCTVHLWLAGAGIFALARHWRLQIAPALVAALSCMFSSWSIANLEFANNLATAVWAPPVILMSSEIARTLLGANTPGRTVRLTRLALGLAVLLAIQYLAGFPEFLVYTAAQAVTYVTVFCVFKRAFRPLIGTLAIFLTAGGLAILISTPQLLPGLEFVRLSERATKISAGLDMASLQFHHLLQFLVPFINGRPGYPDQFWGGTVFEFWIGTCYLGILPLVLAIFSALVFRRDPSRPEYKFLSAFLLVAMCFGILMALGKNAPLYQFFYDHIPGFGHFRFPSKFLVLVLFALSLLAGIGWQEILHFCQSAPKRKQLQKFILLFGLPTIVVLVSGYFFAGKKPEFFRFLTSGLFPSSERAYHSELNDYLLATIFLVASFGIILIPTIGCMRATVWLAPAFIFANLFFVTRDLHPMMDQSVFETKLGTLPVSELSSWRVHSVYGPVQQWFYGNQDPGLAIWAVSAGVGDAWLRFGINQSWQGGQKLARYLALYYMLWSLPQEQAEKLANFLSLRYTLIGAPFDQLVWHGGPRGLQLIEHPNARPRAFLADNWMVVGRVDDPQRAASEILERLLKPDVDLASTAIVEPEVAGINLEAIPVPLSDTADTRDPGQILSFQDEINDVRVDVMAKTKALFILNDAWYPGWTLFVDGAAQPILRTNYHFRGVFLDPGEHKLRFVYAPSQFRLGLWIAASTVALMIALFVFINRATAKN